MSGLASIAFSPLVPWLVIVALAVIGAVWFGSENKTVTRTLPRGHAVVTLAAKKSFPRPKESEKEKDEDKAPKTPDKEPKRRPKQLPASETERLILLLEDGEEGAKAARELGFAPRPAAAAIADAVAWFRAHGMVPA